MGRRPTPLPWPRLDAPPDPADTQLGRWRTGQQAGAEALDALLDDLVARVQALEAAQAQQTVEAEWMTPKAAAVQFGFHADSVSKWARTGRVRSLGAGNSRRVCVRDLEALARHRAGRA